jgi:hypothetical protein
MQDAVSAEHWFFCEINFHPYKKMAKLWFLFCLHFYITHGKTKDTEPMIVSKDGPSSSSGKRGRRLLCWIR